MYLTHTDVLALLELQRFSAQKNSMGHGYEYVLIPNALFQKVLDGVTIMSDKPSMPPTFFGPERFIRERTEVIVAEYIRKNPDKQKTEHLATIRDRAEQTAIIEYLQKLYNRGTLGAP